MNPRVLLKDLRSQDVCLKVDGGHLVVDAPAGAITDEIRTALAEHKPKLVKLLEWERRKLEEADRRGLVIRWSEEPGWIKLHDPTDGTWHEVRAEECLPGVVETANKHRRKEGRRGVNRPDARKKACRYPHPLNIVKQGVVIRGIPYNAAEPGRRGARPWPIGSEESGGGRT